jgi:hypothetical protein
VRVTILGLSLLVLAGCGDPPRPAIPVARVAKAEPVPANAVTLTFLGGGDFLRDGVPMRMEEIPEATRRADQSPATNRDPVLLEVDAGQKFEAVIPLIRLLMDKGRCANQQFLVETSAGRGVIPMCVPVAYSPPGLFFIDGSREFRELGEAEQSHLWIDIHPASFNVSGVRVGRYVASRFYGAKPEDKIHDWPGERPPNGPWTVDSLKSFLARADVQAERPILFVSVSASDVLGPCLGGVAELRQLGVQVMFLYPESR